MSQKETSKVEKVKVSHTNNEKGPAGVKQKKDPPAKKTWKTNFKNFWNKLSKSEKGLFVTGIILGTFALLALLIFVLKIDSYLIPSSLEGEVLNHQNKKIEGAQVCLKDKCSDSDSYGNYILEGLKHGNATITVKAENYKELKTKTNLWWGENKLDIHMEPAGMGSITGSVYTNDGELILDDLKLFFNEEEFSPDEDGNFQSDNHPIGEYILTIASPNYKDIEVNVDVDEKEISVGDIELSPAGDFSSVVLDWLSLEPLQDATIKDTIYETKSDENGEFTIKDLDIGTDIALECMIDNYLTKSLELEIEQGLNEIESIEMVRTGKIVYVSNRMGNQNIYIANYDGSDEKILSDNQGDSYSPYIPVDSANVLYLSTRDKVVGEYGNPKPLIYSVNTKGASRNKISKTNYEDFNGLGSFSFESNKRSYVKSTYNALENKSIYEIYFGNLDGTDINKIYTAPDNTYINGPLIAPDGNFILASLANPGEDKYELFKVVPSSGQIQTLWEVELDSYLYVLDIAPNSKSALVSRFMPEENRHDLWTYNMLSGKNVRITNTSASENQARFSPDGRSVTYLSNRDGRTDLYMTQIDTKEEQKLSSTGYVDDYFWGTNNLVFFNSERVMWIVDPVQINKTQKVTESVMSTYFYSRYQGFGYDDCCGY